MYKAKIKGEWVEYNYAISAISTQVDKILEELTKNGLNPIYLGKSKVTKDSNDVISHLKRRSLFFKINNV